MWEPILGRDFLLHTSRLLRDIRRQHADDLGALLRREALTVLGNEVGDLREGISSLLLEKLNFLFLAALRLALAEAMESSDGLVILKTRDKCDEMKQWPMAILGNPSSTMPYTLSPPAAGHKLIATLFYRASEEGQHLRLTS